MAIVAQFLKKQGCGRVTRGIDLPQRVTSLPSEYTDEELRKFFGACDAEERAIFTTFLLTGMREQEVVHLSWPDVNFQRNSIEVSAKPDLGFYPKRWEKREIPVHRKVFELLEQHPHRVGSSFVFPSPAGNREHHFLDRCKAVARRSEVDEEKFDLKTFRSTYATRMLRAGFDLRTVQHWMGHKSLETTLRYLAPLVNLRQKLDEVQIAGVLP
jgi:integrase